MSTLEELFIEIETYHTSEPCADISEIDDFERRHGYQLPDDLKTFYRRYKSVKLFDSDFGATYRFAPISEIHPTRIDIYGKDTDEWGPSTWLSICDLLDGNYIAIDIASKDGDGYNYIDCFHETFAEPGESKVIAKSFTELLEHALHGRDDKVYYLEEGFIGYGDGMPLLPENATRRIENSEAREKGWLVSFAYKNTKYRKFFSDIEYGGKERAFEAVRQYVEKNSQ